MFFFLLYWIFIFLLFFSLIFVIIKHVELGSFKCFLVLFHSLKIFSHKTFYFPHLPYFSCLSFCLWTFGIMMHILLTHMFIHVAKFSYSNIYGFVYISHNRVLTYNVTFSSSAVTLMCTFPINLWKKNVLHTSWLFWYFLLIHLENFY